jgi:hypothetical protein
MIFLNVVYDNWDENVKPKPNLENMFGENKFKVVNGLFSYQHPLCLYHLGKKLETIKLTTEI